MATSLSAQDLFAKGGEMGALMQSLDWSATPIGAVETWPQSLRTSLSICLTSRFPILIWWGAELVMLYNDAYRPILGATKHPQAMGQRGQECWAEIWDIIGPMLDGVMTTGNATWPDDQLLLIDRNGYLEESYFTFSFSPISDDNGQVGGVFTTVTETTQQVIERAKTERQQAELALREQERFLRNLTDTVPVLLWTALPDGTMDFVSQPWSDYTGMTLAQAIQSGWQDLIHPDDFSETLERWTYALQTDQPYEVTHRVKRADGSYRWCISRAVLTHDQQQNPVRWIGSAVDIETQKQTEAALRESEALYRILAEAIPQFVWITTDDGQNEYVNRQFCEYTGLTVEQMEGLDWLTIIHPDDVEATYEQWMASVKSGRFYEIEYRFRRVDGTYRWFLGQGIPLKNEQGQVVKWFGTCTDIHYQKLIEQERVRLLEQEQAAREAAEEANRIKDEFLAVLSHELRTPLNPILGWTTILRSGKCSPEKTTQALETIERNAKLQTQLIEDLLDMSRILRGKLVLNTAPIDLQTMIAAALETVRHAADAKAIALKTVFESVGSVMGDSGRLQQVVWNLLSNAVKFTSAGGQVEVRLEQSGHEAQITVSDNGKGISADFLPYVFETFRQADSATTRKFGGLGLGLAIVRQIVELHGGTVSADSLGEDRGATFIVRLPLLRQQSEPEKAVREEALPQSPDQLFAHLHALVVDDDADSRDLIDFILQQAGATVITAASALEALQILENSNIDLLVSDIGMAQMDGYTLMQKIKSRFPERTMQAIALTAYAGDVDRQRALEVGFQRHLAKPIDPLELVTVVAELVNKKN